ncbi:MAG: DUF2726 domain-containing protein [Candidatus Nitronauta litoralis]|uniref:DUF2726 domain-containing protein n=1 Tax=Candidatus Nitronauta litoralis TaxID=2705533 RepID=A0A7T0G0U9_9BACT|nr:MAG: DUF2726 domain-containing protein [Candidatus Nitronauta litoralis]
MSVLQESLKSELPSIFTKLALLLGLALTAKWIITTILKTLFSKAKNIVVTKIKKENFTEQKSQNESQQFDRRISTSYFYSKRPVTSAEQKLYFALVRAVPDLLILPQVAFSQFIGTRGGDSKENFALFGTARQKVVDFLICDKAFNIICAIELDDKSHENKGEEDFKRDEILRESGINCLRFKVGHLPAIAEIKETILTNS